MYKKKLVLIVFIFFLFIVHLSAQDALMLYEQGTLSQQRQDWYTALELYHEAVQQNPSYGVVWLAMAECAYELEQYNLALEYLSKAEQFVKNNPKIQNLQGFSLIGLSRLDEAEKIFRLVLEKYPNDIESRFGLAQLQIFKGRIAGAQEQFLEALKREGSNKKALLSLALIASELGQNDKASYYIDQALKQHSADAEVYYFAGYLASFKSVSLAETYIRTALTLEGEHSAALKLLADILFYQKRYKETIEVCEQRIRQNRNETTAWYLKGLAHAASGEVEVALKAWNIGLKIDPQDEIMRAALELLVAEKISLEDTRREQWADYHKDKGDIFIKKYFANQAFYEYTRALAIAPEFVSARLQYANLFLERGWYESYLSQLRFIQHIGKADHFVNDTVESYTSMLSDTVSISWDVDPFYLDKVRWKLAVFYFPEPLSFFHQGALPIVSAMIEDVLNISGNLHVDGGFEPIQSFAQAFKKAREAKFDFFSIVQLNQSPRGVTLIFELYNAKTGNKVFETDIYRTGNDKYSSVLQKLANDIDDILPKKAKIINRRGDTVLLDVGKKENLSKDYDIFVFTKGSVQLNDTNLALDWDKSKAIGTVVLEKIGEDISQGRFRQQGYYDLLSTGDEVIFQEHVEPPIEKTKPKKGKKVDTETDVQPKEPNFSLLYSLIQSIK